MDNNRITTTRSRWAALGAAIAVSVGAGGIGITHAMIDTGERAVFVAIEPCRMLDTRPQFPPNNMSEPIGPNSVFTFDLDDAVGDCDPIPNATALSLNVTPIGPSSNTYLSFVPGALSPPAAGYSASSNLNPTVGEPPTPNAVAADLDADQQFSMYNRFGSVDVAIDIVGYYEDHHHDDRYPNKADVYTKAETNLLVSESERKVFSAKTEADFTTSLNGGYASIYGMEISRLPGDAPQIATVHHDGLFYIGNSQDDEIYCGFTADTKLKAAPPNAADLERDVVLKQDSGHERRWMPFSATAVVELPDVADNTPIYINLTCRTVTGSDSNLFEGFSTEVVVTHGTIEEVSNAG